MSIIVVGHKNPDNDSVSSAIAMADFLTKIGQDATAYTQGEVPPETQFVLNKFGFCNPKLVGDVAGKKVALVDHTDKGQAPDNIADANLIWVVDHHKLGDITTSMPLNMWVWPVGCTCTIIKNIYDFYGVEIPRNIAGLLLSAILTDTLIFKSPTTTDEDKKAVKGLCELSGIEDFKAFGMEIFKIKSAVDGVPGKVLLHRDYKDFNMNGKSVGVGQLEVIDLALLDRAKPNLEQAVIEAKAEGRHTVFLLLTDIMQGGSELICRSDDPNIVEKTFGVKDCGNTWLPGIMSRKKDVIPSLEKAMKD